MTIKEYRKLHPHLEYIGVFITYQSKSWYSFTAFFAEKNEINSMYMVHGKNGELFENSKEHGKLVIRSDEYGAGLLFQNDSKNIPIYVLYGNYKRYCEYHNFMVFNNVSYKITDDNIVHFEINPNKRVNVYKSN